MSQQLRLLPAPKPLKERFGAAFFRGIPKVPGVYRMFGEHDELLYVGQSANLHDRLGSYRHVHPDRDSRKTVRLVHLLRRIEWEVCDSAVSAVLRENELLRTLRPRFNRMNVYPPACWFIGLHAEDGRVRLTLTHEPVEAGRTFGAFKGALAAFASLGRLLFVLGQPQTELAQFPARLLTAAPRRTVEQAIAPDCTTHLTHFLSGESPMLLEVLTDAARLATPFEQNLLLNDLVVAEAFFHRGPQRVRRLAKQHRREEGWIAPEVLLDGLAMDSLVPSRQSTPDISIAKEKPADAEARQ